MAREAIVIVLLVLTVSLTLLCSVGLLVMQTPYERLHFVAPPASIGSYLLTMAVFVGEPSIVAGLKTFTIATLLIFSNAIVSHATGRAARIREKGGWLTGDTLPRERDKGHEDEELR